MDCKSKFKLFSYEDGNKCKTTSNLIFILGILLMISTLTYTIAFVVIN